jgi:hypothetical protein
MKSKKIGINPRAKVLVRVICFSNTKFIRFCNGSKKLRSPTVPTLVVDLVFTSTHPHLLKQLSDSSGMEKRFGGILK